MVNRKLGKKIEISFSKDVDESEVTDSALTEEELIDYLVNVGELMGKNTNGSNFKICVDSLTDSEMFFEKLNQRFAMEEISGIKIVLNMKLSK